VSSLTPKQKAVFDYIAGFTARYDYAPSFTEIRDHFGLKSVSTVANYIRILSGKGYLHSGGSNQKRALSITVPSFKSGQVPLLGLVAAGEPIEPCPVNEFVEAARPVAAEEGVVALRIKGDSMIAAGIYNRDIILVRRQVTAARGSIVVALVNDRATVKRFYPAADHIRLQPENETLPPLIVTPDDDFQIYGVVIRLERTYTV